MDEELVKKRISEITNDSNMQLMIYLFAETVYQLGRLSMIKEIRESNR